MLKGAYFRANTKTFDDISFLTDTLYPGKEIRRISAKSSQVNAYSQFPIRRIHLPPYAVSIYAYQHFHSKQRIDFYSQNDVSVLLNRNHLTNNVLKEARAEQYLAEPSIESVEKYELGEELLKELRSNSYNGRVEEDVVATSLRFLKYSIRSKWTINRYAYQHFHSKQRIDFYSQNDVSVLLNRNHLTNNVLKEARAEQYLAEPSIESVEKYELGEELLKELRSNSYSGRVEEDVVATSLRFLKYSIRSKWTVWILFNSA
nr:hypothetical protein [Tanacetum cinerariifolium]